MSIHLKLPLLLAFLFLAAILNSVFTFQLESYGEEKLKWVNHTHEVLGATEKLLSTMKDTETGQRGYLLTSSASYLEPYHNGLISAKENLDKLKKLTSDNPKQQEVLKSVEKLMKLKFEELAETIELVQSGYTNKALEIVAQNKGKQYMDNIRAHSNSFINTELILLEQRKGDFRENRAQITTLIAVEIVFFIGLAMITITFLRRSLFLPLKLLLSSAEKVESGDKLNVSDVVEKDEMGHLLSTFFVMSEKVYQREQILDHKAHHDELTGLKNRITISKEIEQSLSDLQKTGEKLAVLFLDLNLFKQVNDTLGHDVGDLILKETANRLNSSVRSSDTVFRVGGDEFLVIARNIENITDVHCLIDNILNAFDEPAIIQGKPMDISISIGVAVSPDDTNSSSEIVKFSDVAMYAAKHDKDTNYKMFDKDMLKRASDS